MGLLGKLLGLKSHPPREAMTLGRNATCWCGSGDKYKKCHYDSDREYFSRQRAAALRPRG
jgi:hypothetical protein